MNLHMFITVFVVLFMVTMALHIFHNKVLPRTNRKCFFVASVLVGMYGFLDALLTFIQCHPELTNLRFISICVVIELLFAPSAFAVLAFACDMRKLGQIATAIWLAYAATVTALVHTGKLYTINEAGMYVEGPYAVIIYAFAVAQLSIPAIFTYLLSKRYKTRNLSTLNCLVVMLIFGLVMPYLLDEAGLQALGSAICLSVFYSYYTGLYFQELHENIEKQNQELAISSLRAVQALAGAVDAKDHYTRGHSWRVSEYSVMMGRELGWSNERLVKLRYDALLHDVGKIGIPDSVLNKERSLSDVEYGMIKLHTTLGSEIISKIASDKDTFSAARSHHEKYDGTGYPDHLKGEEIPENARIICIVDSYDAMNSDRIYRRAMDKGYIREEMLKGSGSQFDPALLDVFLKLYDRGDMDVIDDEARSDALSKEGDELADLLEDYLKFFEVKKDYTGKWDEEVVRIKDIYKYLERRAVERNRKYDLAVVSIVAKPESEVTDAKIQAAMSVMLKAADAFITSKGVVSQISQSQLVLMTENEEGTSLEGTIREMLLYYYKIIETGDFKIEYEIMKD